MERGMKFELDDRELTVWVDVEHDHISVHRFEGETLALSIDEVRWLSTGPFSVALAAANEALKEGRRPGAAATGPADDHATDPGDRVVLAEEPQEQIPGQLALDGAQA